MIHFPEVHGYDKHSIWLIRQCWYLLFQRVYDCLLDLIHLLKAKEMIICQACWKSLFAQRHICTVPTMEWCGFLSTTTMPLNQKIANFSHVLRMSWNPQYDQSQKRSKIIEKVVWEASWRWWQKGKENLSGRARYHQHPLVSPSSAKPIFTFSWLKESILFIAVSKAVTISRKLGSCSHKGLDNRSEEILTADLDMAVSNRSMQRKAERVRSQRLPGGTATQPLIARAGTCICKGWPWAKIGDLGHRGGV